MYSVGKKFQWPQLVPRGIEIFSDKPHFRSGLYDIETKREPRASTATFSFFEPDALSSTLQSANSRGARIKTKIEIKSAREWKKPRILSRPRFFSVCVYSQNSCVYIYVYNESNAALVASRAPTYSFIWPADKKGFLAPDCI